MFSRGSCSRSQWLFFFRVSKEVCEKKCRKILSRGGPWSPKGCHRAALERPLGPQAPPRALKTSQKPYKIDVFERSPKSLPGALRHHFCLPWGAFGAPRCPTGVPEGAPGRPNGYQNGAQVAQKWGPGSHLGPHGATLAPRPPQSTKKSPKMTPGSIKKSSKTSLESKQITKILQSRRTQK